MYGFHRTKKQHLRNTISVEVFTNTLRITLIIIALFCGINVYSNNIIIQIKSQDSMTELLFILKTDNI
jgi:hypothetical protein